MYAIVENNTARHASNAAIRDHLKGQGVQMSRQDFDRLSELERNAFGVFTIIVQRDSLLPYQNHVAMPLSFDGVTVTKHLAAVDMALSEAQAKAKANLALIADTFRDAGSFTLQDGTVINTTPKVRSDILRGANSARANVDWLVEQNGAPTWVTLTKAEVQEISAAMDDYVSANRANYKSLWQAIDAAADMTALRVIDINGGW